MDKNNSSFDNAQRRSNGSRGRPQLGKSNLNKTFDDKNDSLEKSADFPVNVTKESKRMLLNDSFEKPADLSFQINRNSGQPAAKNKFQSQTPSMTNSRQIGHEYGAISKEDVESYKEIYSKNSAVQSTAYAESSRRNSTSKTESLKMPTLSVRSGGKFLYAADEKGRQFGKAITPGRQRPFGSEPRNQHLLPDITQKTLESKRTITKEDVGKPSINPTPYST